MRFYSARYIGSGTIVGGLKEDVPNVYLYNNGMIRKQSLTNGEMNIVSYGESFAPLTGGAVTIRGGKLVYENRETA